MADRITETATNTYTYDDEGNRTSSTVKASGVYTVYEWDYRNRLTTVTVYNHQAASGQQILKKVEYTYDAFDMRVSRTVTPYTSGVAGTPTTERYVYDLDNGTGIPNAVFDFYDDDGPSGPHAATLRTRCLDGPVVDQVLALEDVNTVGDDAVLWLLQDNQQSVRDIINNAGTLKNRFEYDAFGQITSVTGGLGTRYLYTGQEYDPETGLYYYNARWYDPATQTFISRDPMGFAAGDTNLYRYVGNAPTNFVDPTGLFGSDYIAAPGGNASDFIGPPSRWRTYWYYLWNPSEQDSDIRYAQKCSLVVAGIAGGSAVGAWGLGINPVLWGGGAAGAAAARAAQIREAELALVEATKSRDWWGSQVGHLCGQALEKAEEIIAKRDAEIAHIQKLLEILRGP